MQLTSVTAMIAEQPRADSAARPFVPRKSAANLPKAAAIVPAPPPTMNTVNDQPKKNAANSP